MEHSQHDVFIQAIHSKNKLQIVYYSAKDDMDVARDGAPMDFGPHARFHDQDDRYHFWDFTSPSGPHTTPLEAEQIRSIERLDETFDPAEFVTWEPQWHIPRDWGSFS
jgi:hypothetical protein